MFNVGVKCHDYFVKIREKISPATAPQHRHPTTAPRRPPNVLRLKVSPGCQAIRNKEFLNISRT
jgi:hypothetical protein